jgi:hypothetical protein
MKVCKKQVSYAKFYNSSFLKYTCINSGDWLTELLKKIDSESCARCKNFHALFLSRAFQTQSIFIRSVNENHINKLEHIKRNARSARQTAATKITNNVLHHQYKPGGSLMLKNQKFFVTKNQEIFFSKDDD